jgi:serralysin
MFSDFKHGIVKFELSCLVFSGIGMTGAVNAGFFYQGAAAHDADDHIIYNPANGWLTYDSNGKAAGGVHHFVTLATGLTLSAGDFVIA